MNKYEKTKLEKLVQEDIDRAKELLREKHRKERNETEEKVPQSAKTKLLEILKLEEEARKLRNKLSKEGYNITGGYGNTKEYVEYGANHKVMKELSAKQERQEEKLKNLQRATVIEIFVQSADSVAVFTNLQRKIENILNG